MISMKIEYKDEKTIIYLYRERLNIDNIDILNKQIKNIFLKLIKFYKMDFFGFSKVKVFYNEKYGSILEIEKIYSNEYNRDIIDLKLVIYRNVKILLEFDDYYFKDIKNIIMKNNKFYLNINDAENIIDYIEFGKIIYQIE